MNLFMKKAEIANFKGDLEEAYRKIYDIRILEGLDRAELSLRKCLLTLEKVKNLNPSLVPFTPKEYYEVTIGDFIRLGYEAFEKAAKRNGIISDYNTTQVSGWIQQTLYNLDTQLQESRDRLTAKQTELAPQLDPLWAEVIRCREGLKALDVLEEDIRPPWWVVGVNS